MAVGEFILSTFTDHPIPRRGPSSLHIPSPQQGHFTIPSLLRPHPGHKRDVPPIVGKSAKGAGLRRPMLPGSMKEPLLSKGETTVVKSKLWFGYLPLWQETVPLHLRARVALLVCP